jgi:hypothetical protein
MSSAKSDDKIRIRFSIHCRRWLLTGMERSGVPVYACFAGAKTGHSLYLKKHQYRTGNCGVHSVKQHGNTEYLLQRQAVFWVGSS